MLSMSYKSDLKRLISYLNNRQILVDHRKLCEDYNQSLDFIGEVRYNSSEVFGNNRIHYGIAEFDKYRLHDRFFDDLDFDIKCQTESEEEAKYIKYLNELKLVELFDHTFKNVVLSDKKKPANLYPKWYSDDINRHIYCKQHNVQGLKKKFRSYIIPNNLRLASCDYSSFQLRILAYLSQDEKLIGYCNEKDLITKLNEEIAPTLGRGIFKTFLYAFLYGAMPSTLAIITKLSKEQVERILKDFEKKFVRSMEYRASFKKKKDMNKAIRKVEADIFNTACINVMKSGIDIAVPLHDAIVIDIRDDNEISKCISIMEQTAVNMTGIPFYAEEETDEGEEWGTN